MHEIRAAIPAKCVNEAVRLARANGIRDVSTSDVFIHGPDAARVLLSVETSTPRARAFADAIIHSPVFRGERFTLTSREVRAIVSDEPVEVLTRPMGEPLPDIIQDLWQLSHLTWSYAGRALAGAVLLATGIIEDNPVSIVASALFVPFLAQVLTVGMGIWNRSGKLTIHGLKAVAASILLAFVGGAAVAVIEGGQIAFHGFRNPLTSFAISAVIGVTAGLSTADDTGRRYLIGVAAAVQLAVFPVWLGVAAVLGLPQAHVLHLHLLTFLINLSTITATGAFAHAMTNRVAARMPDEGL